MSGSGVIGVAGLGLLGRGIAACCLAHGFRVLGYTREDRPHEAARAYIEQAMGDLIERAGFDPKLREDWKGRYQAVEALAEFEPCDWVIECVVEDPAAKAAVFDQIEAVVRPDVVIASNTSAIPISVLQRGRKRPERFVGMHWAEPAHATRFLEVIRGEQTSGPTFQATAELGRRMGKEPSLVRKDVPGFIVNRIAYAMYREAAHMVDEGIADVETIDTACRNALSLWAPMCGPFRWMDISGGPEVYARSLERVLPSLNSDADRLPRLFQQMKEAKARGVFGGTGFYSYRKGDEEKWAALYRDFAWRARRVLDEHFPVP